MMTATSWDVALIKEGDYVVITGGGATRITEVKKDLKMRFGRSGTAAIDSLIGMRFGEAVRLDHATKRFVATDAYPDLDVSEVQDDNGNAVQSKDNRNLVDNNQNQLLTAEEIAAIRAEKGIDALLSELTENSTTFHSKTEFSKEKYLKKKQKKYGTYFKVDRVHPDAMAEFHFPTINPSDAQPEESRNLRLRADTIALILHLSNVHEGSRVLCYDRTNGLLAAYLLTRLGDTGHVYQVLDKSCQPNLFPARQLGVERVKERWSAIPRNQGFLHGTCDLSPQEEELAQARQQLQKERGEGKRRGNQEGTSLWLKGLEAHEMLTQTPADALIIADDEHPERALADLMPFLALGGHVVLYSPFLEDLTGLFLQLRHDCVNIRISETWYRYQQVLPQRTHPTVNMSTAAGYLLTAIKVQPNPNARPRTSAVPAPASAAKPTPAEDTAKRGRDDEPSPNSADEPCPKEERKE